MGEDDLRTFAKQNIKENNFEKTKIETQSYSQCGSAEANAKEIFDKYKNHSKSDLTQEICKLIRAQKQNGTFNKIDILNKISMFSAFIPQEKVNELKELIESIDSQN